MLVLMRGFGPESTIEFLREFMPSACAPVDCTTLGFVPLAFIPPELIPLLLDCTPPAFSPTFTIELISSTVIFPSFKS